MAADNFRMRRNPGVGSGRIIDRRLSPGTVLRAQKSLSAKESSRPMLRNTTLLPLILIAWAGAPGFAAEGARVDGQNIRIEFDGNMHSRVVAVRAGQESVIGDFTPSEFIRVSGRDVTDFSLQQQKRGPIRDQLGPGSRTILTGIAPPLRKTVTVTVYDAFPRIAIFEVAYTNTGSSDLSGGQCTPEAPATANHSVGRPLKHGNTGRNAYYYRTWFPYTLSMTPRPCCVTDVSGCRLLSIRT